MMRIDPFALIFGLTEFVTVVYEPTVVRVVPDIRVEAYIFSVLYVNLVSVVDCCTKLGRTEGAEKTGE